MQAALFAWHSTETYGGTAPPVVADQSTDTQTHNTNYGRIIAIKDQLLRALETQLHSSVEVFPHRLNALLGKYYLNIAPDRSAKNCQ